jgi:hypothetical protein
MNTLKDLALRALHTFWQSFLAVIGVTWAASGLNVSQITSVDSAKRFVLAALIAVAAAALSAVKTTVKALAASAALRKIGKGWAPGEALQLLAELAARSTAPVNVAAGGIQPGAVPETTTAPPAGTQPPAAPVDPATVQVPIAPPAV